MYKKIRKNTARKLFKEGKEICLIPCRARVSMWIDFYKIQIDRYFSTNRDFDKIVNAFEYYNCNPEMGNYAHFYIEEG